jgi:hypothetical protein
MQRFAHHTRRKSFAGHGEQWYACPQTVETGRVGVVVC